MTSEQTQLEAAMSALEAQREVLGDAVVDAGLNAMRSQLTSIALAAEPSAEPGQFLKQVSILFLDVVGSTSLAQRLDPEAVSEVMDDALQRGTALVESHGGKVLQYAGDNILAVFGADEAHEDDPERAVHCGLALTKLGDTLGAEVQRVHGHAGFNVRVGIHTGRVLLGGGVDGDASIRGSSVNIAARMEQTAPAGSLRISDDTFAQVRGLFDVSAQESLVVKGIDAPVRSCIVTGPKASGSRSRERAADGVSNRMFGRDTELEALQHAYRRLVDHNDNIGDGHGRQRPAVITVIGDAGIGKSRLLQEFDAWRDIQQRAVHVFRGRATAQSRDRPFALLGDILGRKFDIEDNDSTDVARAKLERALAPLFAAADGPDVSRNHAWLLGHLMGIDWDSGAAIPDHLHDARQTRIRAFNSAVQVFRRFAESDGNAVVLQLEDLHYADPDSLDFLSHLTDVSRDVALLIVATARSSLSERCPAWARDDGVHRCIELAPLGSADSNLLTDDLLGKLPQVPPVLRDLIIRRAEGNPFYIEELVRMLIDQGAIETAGPWKVNAERLLGTTVPPTLIGVLQARLDSLAPKERQTLQAASVIGPVFWEQALIALHAHASAPLAAIVQRGLVLPRFDNAVDGSREYAFRHQLLHQVTYDTVLKRHKRELHAKAAAWLSTHSGVRAGEFLGAIAEHYERGGDPANAIEFHVRAGEHALTRLAHETVLMHANRALALLGDADDPQLRWRVLRVREGSLASQARRQEQADDLDRMDRLAERLDDDEKRAFVALRRGGRAYEMGEWAEQQAAARRSMEYAERAGEHRVRLSALRLVAAAQIAHGEVLEGTDLLRQALAEARQLGLTSIQSLLLNTMSVAAAARSDNLELLDLQEQSLRICRDTGDRLGEALAIGNLGSAWTRLGDLRKAREYVEQGLRLTRAYGHRLLEGQGLCSLSDAACRQGDHAGALALARSAHDLLAAAGAQSWRVYALLKMGEALLGLGDRREAQQVLAQAHDDAVKLDDPMQHDIAIAMARVALEDGDAQAALECVRDVLDLTVGGKSLHGTEEPRLIEWTVYRVLVAVGDADADKWIARAHDALQTQADRLVDAAMKHAFLNEIPHHREIAAAWMNRTSVH